MRRCLPPRLRRKPRQYSRSLLRARQVLPIAFAGEEWTRQAQLQTGRAWIAIARSAPGAVGHRHRFGAHGANGGIVVICRVDGSRREAAVGPGTVSYTHLRA